jgi:phage baseplate assembly protein gpV
MATLKCTIVLNKTQGLTLKVEDATAGATQTIQLLKDAIITTVSAGGVTSVVTQKADSVAVKCKKFSVDADEIICQSKMGSTFTASTDLKISGTKTVSIDGLSTKVSGTSVDIIAQGALNAEATGPATLKGAVANVTAPVVMLG